MESKLVYWLWLHETPAESQAKISRTLFHFVSIAFIARIIYVIITLFVQPSRSSLLTYSALYHLFVLVIVAYLLRRDKILLGGLLWSTSWWLVQCFTTLSTGIGSIAFHSFYFVVIFVSTFLQIKWLVLLLSVTITIGVIENIARMSDWFTPIPFPSPNPIMQTLIILLIIIVNASIVIYALYTLYTRRSMILWQLEERLGVLKNLYSSQQFFSEKEKLLEEINNNLPGLVYKFLVSPEKNYPVTYVSKQSSALLGIDPNPDTFTKQFHQHLHPDDLAENLAMMITAAS